MCDTYRGHPIQEHDGIWLYTDTKQPVAENPQRPCGYCGRAITTEGYDGCLGKLPGVANACCGHGNPSDAYIQFEVG